MMKKYKAQDVIMKDDDNNCDYLRSIFIEGYPNIPLMYFLPEAYTHDAVIVGEGIYGIVSYWLIR